MSKAKTTETSADTRLFSVRLFQADHETASVDAHVETNGGDYHRVTVTRIPDHGKTTRHVRKFMNLNRAMRYARDAVSASAEFER